MRIGAVCLLSPRSFPMAIARDQFIPRAMRKTCHLCSSACCAKDILTSGGSDASASIRLLVPLLECTAYRVTVQCCRPLRFACEFIRHSGASMPPPPDRASPSVRVAYAAPSNHAIGVGAAGRYPGVMCGGHCRGCGGCPEFRAWHEGRAQAVPSRWWPACDALLEVVQAVPRPDLDRTHESVYGVSYKGRLYTLATTRPPAGTTSKSADPPPCHPPGAAGPDLLPAVCGTMAFRSAPPQGRRRNAGV